MKRETNRMHFRSALIGGLFAAVVVMAAPAGAAALANLVLGQGNFSDSPTRLTGNVATSNLRLVNTHPDGSALRLQVEPGNPPLSVNSTRRVAKLNADRLDGLHKGAFLLKKTVLFASLTNHGDLDGAGNAVSAQSLAVGVYEVVFGRSTVGCSGTATAGFSQSGGSSNTRTTFAVHMGTTFNPDPNTVRIHTWDSVANDRVNTAFHLVIVCPVEEIVLPARAANPPVVDGPIAESR